MHAMVPRRATGAPSVIAARLTAGASEVPGRPEIAIADKAARRSAAAAGACREPAVLSSATVKSHASRAPWILVGLLAAPWLAAPRAEACDCMPTPPFAKALQDSAAVFEGKVLDLGPGPDPGDGPSLVSARLAVIRSWKGVEAPELVVATPNQSSACGFHFQVGETYLIYAHDAGGGLRNTMCGRSRGLAAAADDLKALGVGKTPSPTPPPAGPSAPPPTSASDDPPRPPASPPTGGAGLCSLGAPGPDALLLVGLALFAAARRRRA
jgi:hypothetical protein